MNFTSQLLAIRAKIKNGQVRECFLLLEELIVQLPLSELVIERLSTDLIFFQNDFSSISKLEVLGTVSEEYRLHSRRLIRAILQFVNELENEVNPVLNTTSINDSSKKHLVELSFDLDFETATESEIKALLNKIAAIIKTNPDEFIFRNKRPGSVIVEMELLEETIKKIKSLVKIGALKELKGIQVIDSPTDNPDETKDFNIYLPDSKLSRADLRGADLFGANLIEAFLFGANLSGADLRGADLFGANLSEANLSEASLSEASLFVAKLSGATLSGANLNGANLNGANLNGANLSKADLSGANLSKADLSEADLSGAKLSKADLIGANLNRAKLSNADLIGAKLSKANLIAAGLSGANLSKADLIGAKLSRADLRGAKLSSAKLSSVNLSSVNLSSANLSSANLIGANLSKANLSKADLSKADLRGAKLIGAKLIGAKLIGAKLSRAVFHIGQARILKAMNVDISEVVFVDDEGRKIDSGVVVE